MDWLWSAMSIFIAYPIVAAAIGLVLFGMGRRRRRQVVALVGIMWLLYAIYEFGNQHHWWCSGECNIRIDLLLIYPVLLLGLVAAAVSLVRGAGGPRPSS